MRIYIFSYRNHFALIIVVIILHIISNETKEINLGSSNNKVCIRKDSNKNNDTAAECKFASLLRIGFQFK